MDGNGEWGVTTDLDRLGSEPVTKPWSRKEVQQSVSLTCLRPHHVLELHSLQVKTGTRTKVGPVTQLSRKNIIPENPEEVSYDIAGKLYFLEKLTNFLSFSTFPETYPISKR